MACAERYQSPTVLDLMAEGFQIPLDIILICVTCLHMFIFYYIHGRAAAFKGKEKLLGREEGELFREFWKWAL